MLHIYKRDDGQYGVVNVAKNSKVVAPNEGFTRRAGAIGNILAQWKSLVGINKPSGVIFFQDDTTIEPGIWMLNGSGKKFITKRPPGKRYIPKRRKKA